MKKDESRARKIKHRATESHTIWEGAKTRNKEIVKCIGFERVRSDRYCRQAKWGIQDKHKGSESGADRI